MRNLQEYPLTADEVAKTLLETAITMDEKDKDSSGGTLPLCMRAAAQIVRLASKAHNVEIKLLLQAGIFKDARLPVQRIESSKNT